MHLLPSKFFILGGKKTYTKGVVGLKLDMAKAYNQVEWCFLEKVPQKMGFLDEWT